MRLFAVMCTTGVLFGSAIVFALVGFPVLASGVDVTPTPTIPETLQARCAAQVPGVWLITDEAQYAVAAPVHVALCNRLETPITTRLSDDPSAPLLHVEQWAGADTAWLLLFDVTVTSEDNGTGDQAPDHTPYARLLPGDVLLLDLVAPQEAGTVSPGGPYVSPPVAPQSFDGSLSDLPSPPPWNPLTPTQIVPRDGRPFERQAATPTAAGVTSETQAHMVTLLRALEPGFYRLRFEYRTQTASEFETTYSPYFEIREASTTEVPPGEEMTP